MTIIKTNDYKKTNIKIATIKNNCINNVYKKITTIENLKKGLLH